MAEQGRGQFDGAAYEAEARERWGHSPAYQESARRTKGYGAADWERIRTEADAILADLAALKEAGEPAGSQAAMDAAERHRMHIDRWFYPCSHAMHAGLADMYVADERFGEYFEARGEGLTEYVAEAMRANGARGRV